MTRYFPPEGDWERADPAGVGLDPAALGEAVAFAEGHESPWPRDLSDSGSVPGLTEIEPVPWNEFLGPLKPRGGPAGLILRGGRIAAEWGEPDRVEMTFSIAKSYLSVLTGVALGDGLIASIDEKVSDRLGIEEFASLHNREITWRHLLTQTSEWEGTLFGKPDQVDRYRQVGAGSDNSRKGEPRPLETPGTYWEYNDVRVNVLSLALLHLFQRPLPEILKERIMDPIGASDGWTWHGYRNSEVELYDGRTAVSVPGGTHWGGGLWIDSYDHARFAELILADGLWGKRRLLPEGWVNALVTPCSINPVYGLLWWLNTGGAHYPSAPESSFFAMGAGTSLIWIDRSLDLVAVVRWIDQAACDGFAAALMKAVRE